ncbi:unnamed protein product [Ambrosiozyma monospora]|uniref:Unnamed protein product n=1 Tax=Ambrosiozyma monospora TaxID=43982 RepID=A0ACB5TPQ9_AMBMO|nr:unnamed protein product [Ambrosiozyma monospora]
MRFTSVTLMSLTMAVSVFADDTTSTSEEQATITFDSTVTDPPSSATTTDSPTDSGTTTFDSPTATVATETSATSYSAPSNTFADGISSLSGTYGISLITVSTSASSTSVETTAATSTTESSSTEESTSTEAANKVKRDDNDFIAQIVGGSSSSSTSEEQQTISTSPDSSENTSSSTSHDTAEQPTISSICSTNGALQLSLNDGVLIDSAGRIGSIVSNYQFQFDGPPPQAGYIYGAGWSVDNQGILYLGDSDVFYQCLSGNFYNLYSENIDSAACEEIKIQFVELKDC